LAVAFDIAKIARGDRPWIGFPRRIDRRDTVAGEDEAGRVRLTVDQDLNQRQRDQQRRSLAIGATVQAALREDRLLFAFQPVVCATTGKVDYFECLLRMRDEDGGIVSGGEFITTIEQLGLIGLIDRFVLEQTVRELASHPELTLGFNVSGLTACDRPWLRSLMSLLRNRPDLARRLVVEITETAALYDIEESARFVDTLRHAGCRVALDDFGAGHTSLRHLQILAVDIVKIDGSFVRNLAGSPENRIFLRHLLGLTKGFGLSTVAECVENAEDAALLRAEGVGYLQGYHTGPPTIERVWLGGRRSARVEICQPAKKPGKPNSSGSDPTRSRTMVRQDLGYHERDASNGWDMQELVGAMRVGVGSEHTGDDELRLREFFAEHRHKRDTAAFPHVGGRRSEGDLGAVREGLFEPRRQGRGIPPGGARSRLKLDPRAVGRVFLQ